MDPGQALIMLPDGSGWIPISLGWLYRIAAGGYDGLVLATLLRSPDDRDGVLPAVGLITRAESSPWHYRADIALSPPVDGDTLARRMTAGRLLFPNAGRLGHMMILIARSVGCGGVFGCRDRSNCPSPCQANHTSSDITEETRR